jgi:hypothetical protein
MGHADYYAHGSYNMQCDSCGFKFKAFELRRRWDALMVCGKCWEPRHPQDSVRARRDQLRVPVARPEGENVFIEDNEVQPEDFP